jgi:hypothetical protein
VTETEPKEPRRDHVATQDELQVIDAATAAIDAGEVASEREIEAAFRKFRSKWRSIRAGR